MWDAVGAEVQQNRTFKALSLAYCLWWNKRYCETPGAPARV